MKLVKENGEEYIRLDSEEEMACIRFIEEAMCEQLEAINPKAIWAINAVLDVLDEEGDGIVTAYIER